MTTSERLVERLRSTFPDLAIPEGSIATRVYAPRSGRNLGAWSWFLQGPDGIELKIGSRHTMKDILRAKDLVISVENDLSVLREYSISVLGDEI